MKNFVSICLMCLLVFSCQQKSDKSNDVDLSPLTITMDVKGMTCNGCVETVRASVAQLGDGVSSVEVSLENGNALIEYSPAEIDSVKIREAIEINGFKVTAVKKAE